MKKTLIDVLLVTTVVAGTAAAAYFLGFPMLFAHTAVEVFYYAGLFGGVTALALIVKGWFTSSKPAPVATTA